MLLDVRAFQFKPDLAPNQQPIRACPGAGVVALDERHLPRLQPGFQRECRSGVILKVMSLVQVPDALDGRQRPANPVFRQQFHHIRFDGVAFLGLAKRRDEVFHARRRDLARPHG